ncbi:hypothetical protein PHYSODRAFT_313985 [Phytophthora sojae]|uniref:EamA domain-containing protein n=1 Tax=Phytophthora sojae (strain P6497) TaxID=1094619 RepID=G4ZCD6_PHYSP|nr:hypothetical protein PHYSODRAFT_313985 [Phytophthora sojae]EGZ22164.1 hypothetical protein PHYSODRAFT_313985 [Phytophthora sojae]|eukprot:XP_009524881.1 hypothetical protein PHYSODRAFT_313985 [Phytophthora sojae]
MLYTYSTTARTPLVWSWVLQSEASQALQEVVRFDKPFFIVCFNHTMTAVVLPLVVGFYWITGERENALDVVDVLKRHSVIPFDKLCWISACLSLFYLFADYFWYAALANVSPSFGKICGVFTSFVGVTMVVMFQDGSDVGEIAGTSLVAGLLVVVSAALYRGYVVALRLAVGDDITDTTTLLAMTGLCELFTVPLSIVGSFALAYSPFESLQEPLGFPVTGHGVFLLLLSGMMAVVFNIFLPFVGVMLTIPLSGVIDTLMHHTAFSWQCIVGSALVMGGFGILEYCNGPPEASNYTEEPDSMIALVLRKELEGN